MSNYNFIDESYLSQYIEEFYNKYLLKIIVFCHNEPPSDFDIKWYLEKYHTRCAVTTIKIADVLDNNIDNIFDNIKSCDAFYITTDSRRIRSAIRSKIKEKFGIDIHISKYSKIVRCVNRISWLK
jgi:hypothetical protein